MSTSSGLNFVSLEEAEQQRWQDQRIFERSMEIREGGEPFIFYEGPPTANGKPGLHHVWARTFKDLFCRYKTMQGYYVERRAGWDTHGLPVEVEVEKKLGLKTKRDIEAYGIEKFTAQCRESVMAYIDDWRLLTSRMAFWVDLDDAYWTFDSSFVQSVWWQIRQMWDKGLLFEDLKGVPYCPRCGTALSSHELGQPGAYKEVSDLSAYVAFPLTGDFAGKSLIAWTTTPWTLTANTGLAVNTAIAYMEIDNYILAKSRVDALFGEGASEHAKAFDIASVVGAQYTRPFADISLTSAPRVVDDNFVSEEDGTGVVHIAPAFGEIDREVGNKNGLAVANPLTGTGDFDDSISWAAGKSYLEVNEMVVEKLRATGALVKDEMYTHDYPHCWRCSTRLVYWGKQSWYIATSQFREKMMTENQTIGWNPETVKQGRFGEWLEHNVDWALSRDRFWGTPLPIWKCKSNHTYCIESLDELGKLSKRDLNDLDPHRPHIDEVTFPCTDCGETMVRESAVIDVWFDSGAMPAAQWGYPHKEHSKEKFVFPADFIAEAIDQTRGWFYSLLAVNTLVFGSTPYKNVLCLGLLVDKDGRKMSKSVGNVVDPWDVMNTVGADACRWWMLVQGSPWTSTRTSMDAIRIASNETLVTLWNSWKFFDSYRADYLAGSPTPPPVAKRSVLDRWILSRLNETIDVVTRGLDNYSTLEVAQTIRALIDDTSNWYIRLSRRRFWNTDSAGLDGDYVSACATLHEVLTTISLLLAPLTPYMSDLLWRALEQHDDTDSVHLADWPVCDTALIDTSLNASMALARDVASLGRAARSKSGIKVRQPLRRALVVTHQPDTELMDALIANELNVDHVELAHGLREFAEYEIAPLFPTLGPKLGEDVKHIRTWIANQNIETLAQQLLDGKSVEATVGNGTYTLEPEDFQLRLVDLEGYAVAQEHGVAVILDLHLDDELIARGLAREAIRQVQDLRKSSGFDISDRIALQIEGVPALDPYLDEIASEVLATDVKRSIDGADAVALTLDDENELRVAIARV